MGIELMPMDDYNGINIKYINTGKWKIEDYNDDYIPITWTTKGDNTWTINGDKYYYEKYYSSPFEPQTIVSVDLADDSKKESKDTITQDDDTIVAFDWDNWDKMI